MAGATVASVMRSMLRCSARHRESMGGDGGGNTDKGCTRQVEGHVRW